MCIAALVIVPGINTARSIVQKSSEGVRRGTGMAKSSVPEVVNQGVLIIVCQVKNDASVVVFHPYH